MPEIQDAPEVLRRKVRNMLRQERENREITQKQAAQRVLWSPSKLIRIESGVSPAAPADVRVLMREYGADEGRVSELVDLAFAARQPDAWDGFRKFYSPTSISLFANERSANLIQKHEASAVPGLLQTEDYARALLTETRVDPSAIEGKVRGRMLRQEAVGSESGPELDFIIGEATVSRPVGGVEVMRNQIDRLKRLNELKRVSIRFMPFSRGAYPGLGSAFTILSFRDADLADLVYLESSDRESIVRDDTEEVERYNQRYAELQELARAPEELAESLDEVAAYRFGKF